MPADLRIGFGVNGAAVKSLRSGAIADTANVVVGAKGQFQVDGAGLQNVIGNLTVTSGGQMLIGGNDSAHLSVATLTVEGTDIEFEANSTMTLRGHVFAAPRATVEARLLGDGTLLLASGQHNVTVEDGPGDADASVNVTIAGPNDASLALMGKGTIYFGVDNTYAGPTGMADGTLIVTGQQPASNMILLGGTLTGGGRDGNVSAGPATLAPMFQFHTGWLTLTADSRFRLELASTKGSAPVVASRNSTRRGVRADADASIAVRHQLIVHGDVQLNNAILVLTLGQTDPLTASRSWTTTPAIPSTARSRVSAKARCSPSADRCSGSRIAAATATTSSSRWERARSPVRAPAPGPGPNPIDPATYFLAEGATGGFFDDDVLIANPNQTEAPVTLTFLQEGGSTVVGRRTVPAHARLTVHVDQIAGLESTSASVQIVSDNKRPLIVERSMFWDASYYGGHTANAVARREPKWIFAEGSQGFFDTYILIADTNEQPTTATLTFLREAEPPVVAMVPIEAFARDGLHRRVPRPRRPCLRRRRRGGASRHRRAIDVLREHPAALVGRWSRQRGDRRAVDVVVPRGRRDRQLLQHVHPVEQSAGHGGARQLRFLLDTGEVITRQKTIEARQRLTINPAAEGDARLENAAVSTVVTSDAAIVSERSMYWPGDASPFGEGHNSSGVVSTWTRWDLAEGRIGGPHAFDTFILLANPSSQAAEVTITYLRESGPPIVQTCSVPPTSRYNVDVKTAAPELIDSAFGPRIQVTNHVPIAVERSL